MREDPESEKDYVPFMINRALSFHSDSIMYCNEMNRYASIPKQWQFDFYMNSLKKRKRFSKWHKKDKNSEDLSLIMSVYSYSAEKASIALELLTEDQLKDIRAKYFTGGR